ncbi:hypothetical protein LTR56_025035 [Elasticomyces elasticus]|nr:hypothetical protein LTR56_025035 [Elasticomyces elasticus]KAK5741566.1 hypothetical protein LTS12_024555 [Elasticomyces elasticus]
MARTVLIVGAIGNTGRSVALTRSADSQAAKELAGLPVTELAEQNWVEMDEQWLLRHEVARVFIASHNLPNQFAEGGQFLVNCLRANVEYVHIFGPGEDCLTQSTSARLERNRRCGEQIVKLVEQHISEAVNDVRFKDSSMIDQMVDDTNESKNVIRSIKFAPTTSWAGEAKANTTSKEILELYGPKRTASEVLKKLLEA